MGHVAQGSRRATGVGEVGGKHAWLEEPSGLRRATGCGGAALIGTLAGAEVGEVGQCMRLCAAVHAVEVHSKMGCVVLHGDIPMSGM